MKDKFFFDEQGYLIKTNFFDKLNILACLDQIIGNNLAVVEMLQNISKSPMFDKKTFAIEAGNLKYLANANTYFKSINKLITSRVQSFAENLLDEDVYLDAVELHQKAPGASLTPPHQDNFYFCLKNGKSLTAYIPLNEQSKKNGALSVLPKSHLHDFPHYKSDVVGFSSGIELNCLADFESTDYILKPGDLSFHHCNTVHLAPPNNSDKPRVNIALRFQGVSDRISKKKYSRYINYANQSTRISS
jgi:ectoine hydroxylase-related dioxygenase (phytanoyl-CoA dioxygenase family)